MKAVIVGAGIGGLAAGLCLQRTGWDVIVLEQAAALGDVGAGIQISPNGSRVLDALGLLDTLKARAFEPEAIEMRIGRDGRSVFRIPLTGVARQRWGAPYLHLHRADLLDALANQLDAVAPGALRLGMTVSGFEASDEQVTVNFGDGDSIDADLLIGADGIHSTVREQLTGRQPARFTGQVAWRATVPMSLLPSPPPPTACIWVGRRQHAVTYRLRAGELANFVGVVEEADWREESWSTQGDAALALEHFGHWDPVLTGLIEQAVVLHRWALFDRPPLPRWAVGRVALMGDASHPMLPFLAQGATLAMEDAWTLAAAIESGDGLAESLQRWFPARLQRARRVQREATANARRFHLPPLLYQPLRMVAAARPESLLARNDWLFGHDVTAIKPVH